MPTTNPDCKLCGVREALGSPSAPDYCARCAKKVLFPGRKPTTMTDDHGRTWRVVSALVNSDEQRASVVLAREEGTADCLREV